MTRGRRWIAVAGSATAGIVAGLVIVGVVLMLALVPWVFGYLLRWMGMG
jgi:hypothetical protein